MNYNVWYDIEFIFIGAMVHCMENSSKKTILYIFDEDSFKEYILSVVGWTTDVETSDTDQLFM